MDDGPPLGYRFGPPEQRGVVAGLQPGQIVTLAGTGLGIVAALRALPAGAGLPLALVLVCAAAGLTLWPVAGRPVYAWFPLAGRHAVLAMSGRRSWRSPQPVLGVSFTRATATAGAPGRPPPTLAGLELREHPTPPGAPPGSLGVLVDQPGTWTAVLSARSTSFALLGRSEQQRRLSGWASVLASLARERSAVRRVQWVERTLPSDAADLHRVLDDRLDRTLRGDDAGLQSYRELVAAAGPITQCHELLIALQVDGRRSGRTRHRRGGAEPGPGDVLARELATLARRLREADVEVVALLSPGALARALRTAFTPNLAGGGQAGEVRGDRIENALPWPLAAQVSWSRYQADGFVHATFWVAEWPRTEVGPDFLGPLLVQTQAVRTVAVTMQPIAPLRAIRDAEAARVAELSDSELRGRAGFIRTARQDRRHRATAQREAELADGHADVRFSGYVTVSAASPESLEQACVEVEHAGHLARLELRRLYGAQDVGFTYTLPLCRGLR